MQAQPARVNIADSPVPIQVLAQSPAETAADLQVICLFRSSAKNTLHGSLIELNEKMKGLLDGIRKPDLFRGDLGETFLFVSKTGLGAKRLLVIGLGDSETFLPERMQVVGAIVYSEASRLGVARPFFAPTILDGGVSRFTTGQVSEQVIGGFLRAARTARVVEQANASGSLAVAELIYLAGSQHMADTRDGIERAIAKSLGR